METPMNMSAEGLQDLKSLESLRLVAYWDKDGWALGYGQHGPNIVDGSTCDVATADEWMTNTIEDISKHLSASINVPLTQRQFDALNIFTYNIGINAFKNSSLLKRLNGGNYACVPDEINRWVFADGKVDKGLQARRAREVEIWNSQS